MSQDSQLLVLMRSLTVQDIDLVVQDIDLVIQDIDLIVQDKHGTF